jgi:hypothetical protein
LGFVTEFVLGKQRPEATLPAVCDPTRVVEAGP